MAEANIFILQNLPCIDLAFMIRDQSMGLESSREGGRRDTRELRISVMSHARRSEGREERE